MTKRLNSASISRTMPTKGRPRLTPEAYQERLSAYCARYGLEPGAQGLAPFPAGRRETRQHREWMSLYKSFNRLARRGRGQCERCSAPATEGSILCEAHRAEASARTGAHGASAGERRDVLQAQKGRCPICGHKVELQGSVDHGSGQLRAVLHPRCNQLVALAEAAGPEVLGRLRAYLWPDSSS